MSYKPKPLQIQKAKKLGLTIEPSSKKNKKIDVKDKDGNVLASIGGVKKDGSFYMDYASYIEKIGLKDAKVKRKNYLARHSKEPKEKDGKKTPSYYSDKILW
jgi:hypothetical protein